MGMGSNMGHKDVNSFKFCEVSCTHTCPGSQMDTLIFANKPQDDGEGSNV